MIPQKTVEKENLSYNEISTDPLKDLLYFQEGMSLKMAPSITKHPSSQSFWQNEGGPCNECLQQGTKRRFEVPGGTGTTTDQENTSTLATGETQFQLKNNAVDHLLKILEHHDHTDLPSSAENT